MRKLGGAVPVLLMVLSDEVHFMLLVLTGLLDSGALGSPLQKRPGYSE